MLSPTLLDAVSSFGTQVTNMHRYMVTIYGALIIGGLLILLFFLLREPEKLEPRLSLLLAAGSIFQVGSGVLMLLTYQWSMGIQLAFFGLFGLFSAFTCKRDFLRLHAMFSLFFFLAVLGYLQFLGYSSLYTRFDSGAPGLCNTYFGLVQTDMNGLCYGYQSFMRVVVFSLIAVLGLQSFIAYYMYKEEKGERPYEAVGGR